MLSATVNVAKSAQNCPKLPKTAQIWNFEIPPKIEILVLLKNKIVCVEEALEHVFTVWIFNPRIFHMLFLLSKNGLCMWISAYPLAENDFFLNIPHLLWVWDFEDMYLTHLETRIWRSTFHIYFEKWFFWPSKLYCLLWAQGKKTFLSTLKVMILQMVRNECVRFGEHVDIEVRYKTLQLDVLWETQILHNLSCFE
jgi:hypothetical protein